MTIIKIKTIQKDAGKKSVR